MTTWAPCTEDRFDEMLGMLPPAYYSGAGFLVGEPMSHRPCTKTGRFLPDYAAFVQVDGQCYEGPSLTVPEFKAFMPSDLAAKE